MNADATNRTVFIPFFFDVKYVENFDDFDGIDVIIDPNIRVSINQARKMEENPILKNYSSVKRISLLYAIIMVG